MIHHRKQGFTLVELMLSMSFVGILLVAIAVTSMQIMSTYTKGLTIREVNHAGRAITDDVQRTIATSSPFKANPARGGEVDEIDSKYVSQEGGGRLCTGAYTYAWNYGNTFELSEEAGAPPVYNRYESSSDVIRLVKVSDIGGALCADMSASIPDAEAKELLLPGDRELAVQQFIVTEGVRDEVSGQAMYAISLTLGTNDQEQLDATNTTCLPPLEGEGNEDFCAINQFNIVVRAGNRSGSL